MVNFQIASDLHIETMKDTPSSTKFITPSADVLILAGDIGRIHRIEQLEEFMTDVCSKFVHVIYVLGNHEYYRTREHKDKTMEELFLQVKNMAERIGNLHILDRNHAPIIIDDVLVAGCTLWSNSIRVPDFIVRVHGMTPTKYNYLHSQDVQYITSMIKYCKSQKKKYKLLVVTHHAPTYSLIKNTKKDRDKYKSLYVSNLDYLLDKNRVHTWVCGHLHINFDRKSINGTRLVGNQQGKPRDNIRDYRKNMVITV